ncbi:glycoside hydrolase family 3 C-terminal domain-containing protein [Microbacterium sp. QXD-8]|uniref:Glycoside hydrolase family 3 C-terminal domain-containing protein n=1 Tax=Microbacterium psychrotolerans TaxID=3068321 RepID=A0ABU0Z903_9MICO|nr:glycoside hydrolase family 3 C-terminal domain-containing protein [Microbacterium sp. QXD-8]MDQ7880319.1 glycoside hydrolase family 3 C-terminal domain-containing protein [Microbacterium sp. QXD-8]
MPKPPLVRRAPIALGAVVALTAALLPAAPAMAESAPCIDPGFGKPMQVTADCNDQTYADPVIDAETDETSPVPHHRLAGHFEGTDIQFTIYLHAEADKNQWEGRFFQYTYPTVFTPGVNLAEATDRAIGFAPASGGYAVQAGNTSLSLGYRHAAAAAKFAETVAAEYYGTDRVIYGYLYGPSGGSFQTVGAAENTEGVWQGFVPMVQAVPTPNSYNFNGRAAAELILGEKAAEIRDALLPGGSGDPYATLDEAERALLTEVHKLGIPWKGWENPDYLLGRDPQFYGAGLDSDSPLSYDPTYVDDFWNAPGHLGTENTPLGQRVRAELAEMGDTVGHRWNIAKRFAYRYQLPPASTGWIALDQFRVADGTPIYPQRPVAEPGFSGFVSGFAAFDGSINGKVIVVSNLYDTDALPIHTDWYRKQDAAAIVVSSYGGPFGPAAVADVLFGAVNPSGKLPYSIPRHTGQIPVYHHQRAGTGYRNPLPPDVDRHYLDVPATPLFTFGHGLSYTKFVLSDLVADAEMTTSGSVRIAATVENAGERSGDTVVQLYARVNTVGATRPAQQLAGFARVSLDAGEARRVTFTLDAAQLGCTDIGGEFVVEPSPVNVWVSFDAASRPLETVVDVIGPRRRLRSSERTFLSASAVSAS